MPPTFLLFCYRLPTITPTEFRNYIEDKHVPYTRSLLGANSPLSHTRYYLNKDSGYVVGAATPTDADLVAIVTFKDKEAMQRSMSARMADGVRELIQADEAKFMDVSKVQLVRIGEEDMRQSVNEA